MLPTLTELADTFPLEAAAKQGDVLSPAAAGVLENLLERNPLDIVSRARLLGFYYRYYWKRRVAIAKRYRDLRVKHIVWFVESAPDCRFASDYYLAVDKKGDGQNYHKVTNAWEDAIRRAESVNVFGKLSILV